jgi:hypothetical protein
VLVRAVPAVDGVPLTNVDNLREFVTQLEATNGSAATKPRSIVRLLQSKACRGTAVRSFAFFRFSFSRPETERHPIVAVCTRSAHVWRSLVA